LKRRLVCGDNAPSRPGTQRIRHAGQTGQLLCPSLRATDEWIRQAVDWDVTPSRLPRRGPKAAPPDAIRRAPDWDRRDYDRLDRDCIHGTRTTLLDRTRTNSGGLLRHQRRSLAPLQVHNDSGNSEAMDAARRELGPEAEFVLLGRSIETGSAISVAIRGGIVMAVDQTERGPGSTWIGPGWVDLQINGFEGHDPNATDTTDETAAAMVRSAWRAGLTGICVTICTESEPHMLTSFRAVAAACEKDPLVAATVIGIHVEGPHIAREDGPRGVHPLRYVRPPDVDEYRRWQDAAGGRIRIITLSPEYENALGYIRAIVADGVVASIGHTAATSEQIRAAVDAGARWSTHLGNGSHALIRRHPNYIWDQLAEDRLSAGFIFDGQHLPPAVMKTVIRAKGVERSILVSDAMSAAGLPPGVYRLPDGVLVELLPSGRLELQGTPYLAGAAAPLSVGIANAVRHAGVSLADAIRMVTANPSRLLGLPTSAGYERMQVGSMANMTLFRQSAETLDVEVAQTVVAGHTVYNAEQPVSAASSSSSSGW
jgi:N-acetylglucosamine-6-phosphate deacetylase